MCQQFVRENKLIAEMQSDSPNLKFLSGVKWNIEVPHQVKTVFRKSQL